MKSGFLVELAGLIRVIWASGNIPTIERMKADDDYVLVPVKHHCGAAHDSVGLRTMQHGPSARFLGSTRPGGLHLRIYSC
ncbi:protein of unknown function [Pseudorhizobium banfieldiae]|uniref:Uncharacterized protein n=1 Tax=Pseudorhizobium banfieldiae TaxID=1125847 RepID=L0NL96_9HYPH|nr:hypothetical protein RNT25_00245 [arsenite-oxidising bacterium NT-25]CAD6617361.1 hypothetical protein RKHAN_03365 [Rhizobium sp. Khangiran2]CCF21845.1 protein of unknown function [Pseudorhizobium banfieldiae]